MKKILLLGSTGSIGQSSLNCIRRLKSRFEVCGLAARSSVERLISQIDEFSPRAIYCADLDGVNKIRARYGTAIKFIKDNQDLKNLLRKLTVILLSMH